MKKLMTLIAVTLAAMTITACHGPHGRFDGNGDSGSHGGPQGGPPPGQMAPQGGPN